MDAVQRYYALVEEKIDADPRSAYSRSSLLLDGVDANRFDSQSSAIDDPSALSLIRAMTTEGVWLQRHQLGDINKGDWVEISLDSHGGASLAWEMRADEDYRRGPKRSLRSIRRLGRFYGKEGGPGDRTRIVRRLHKRSNAERGDHQRLQLATLANIWPTTPTAGGSPGNISQVKIRILDVGQASASLIFCEGKPFAMFDVGAPLWFNSGSVAFGFTPPVIGDAFIFLSHWDFDHFDMGRRVAAWHTKQWYAPDQPIGPNTALFQRKLGSNLTFVDGPIAVGGFRFERGTSLDRLDRNGTGYQLRYENGDDVVLLTGDADYSNITTSMLAGVTHICIPHHGGKGTPPPRPSNGHGHSTVSYGLPNRYRHPHLLTIQAHEALGWTVIPTANASIPRGNRQLYPTP